MAEWVVISSTLIGLLAGFITIYDFFSKRSYKSISNISSESNNIELYGKKIFFNLLRYARFEFVVTRIGGFILFLIGFAALGWADENGVNNVYVFGGFFASIIILWMLFIYPMRKRTIRLARRSAIGLSNYNHCIDSVASASGVHKYSFDGIRKIVSELVDDLR